MFETPPPRCSTTRINHSSEMADTGESRTVAEDREREQFERPSLPGEERAANREIDRQIRREKELLS